jgi:fucose 4-O-acetylase-like acetyltransferase
LIANRNHTLDVTKGLGIILVVLGHNWLVLHEEGELFRIIFSFHMPLFFFLSGMFLRNAGTFKEFAVSRANSLLKPYFATLFFVAIITWLFQAFKTKALPPDFLRVIKGIFYATGSTIEWVPLWFLPHLFIVSVVAFLILRFVTSIRARIPLAIASLGAGVFILNPVDLPWSIDLLPISLSFLLTGYLCRNFVKSMPFNGSHLVLAVAAFSSLHFFYNETINLNFRHYGNFIVSTLQALLGIYICLSLSSLLTRWKFVSICIAYIGSGSLFILLFHSFFQGKIFNLVTKITGMPLLAALTGLIGGLVLPLLFWNLAQRNHRLHMIFLPYQPIQKVR